MNWGPSPRNRKMALPGKGRPNKAAPRAAAALVAAALLLLAVAAATVNAQQEGSEAEKIVHSFPDGVPGSGYGCDRTCDDADVNYVLRARLRTYEVPNSETAPGFPDREPGQPVSMFTRTFEGVVDESSPFCTSTSGAFGSGTEGPLGPCLTVLPGQRIKIKLVNDMTDGMEQLKQHRAELEGYWKLVTEPGRPNLDSIEWFGPTPQDVEDMVITNEQDLPGWDATFDDVNIHLHGMQVVPHLFFPQGTGNPAAEWITVQPENENPDRKCFCYVIDVPGDHPQGTFFWHIHRHGSVTMQAWQGMVGLLRVGNATNPGSPDYELAQQGVTRDVPFVLWEWAVGPTKRVNGTNTWFEDNFIPTDDGNPITTFLTNDEYQPTLDFCVNETVHVRLLCAQTTTGSAIYILDENSEVVPFHVFASDGVSYGRPYQKNMVVIGPGQREGLLLQFSRPGLYRVMQSIINDYQGDSEVDPDDNSDTPAGYINVTSGGAKCPISTDPVDVPSLTFTPGISSNITSTEITSQVSVNFQVQSLQYKAPVPQFVIDGKEFDYRRISHTMNATQSSQWTLTSNMNYFHPFHIHVNPFQVASITSGKLPGKLANMSLLDAVIATNMEPPGMWRDTVFIPPFGVTVIHQRFGEREAWTGKTVYHCHFLDHEDQGMISAMMIADPGTVTSVFDNVTDVEVGDDETVSTPGEQGASSSSAHHYLSSMTLGLASMAAVMCCLL